MSSYYGFTFSVTVEANNEMAATTMANELIDKIRLEKGSIVVIDAGVEDGPDDLIEDPLLAE